MTWTYTPDFTTTRDQIRFLVGDTDSSDPLITDEEIAWVQTIEGGVQQSAARCAEAIAAEFARKCDKTAGQLSISLSQKSEQYSKLAAKLRARGSSLALPTFGGISKSDVTTRIEDSDRVIPAFYVGMLDNPPTVQGSSS